VGAQARPDQFLESPIQGVDPVIDNYLPFLPR